ncbi:MAG TPA: EamA family transporter [Herpetosiphonaceae bacterium]
MQHSERAARSRGIGAITAAAVLWGTVGVTTQTIYGLASTNALSIGFWRLALAAPVLLAFGWRRLGRGMWRIARRDLAWMALIGAMLGLYQVCFFAAISQIGVAVATLVTLCTAPVFVAAISIPALGERLSGAKLLALAGALAGTALLVELGPAAGRNSAAGILLALGSGAGYATMTIAGRKLADRCHPLQTTAVSFSSGALMLLACAAPAGFVAAYPLGGWLLLVYLGVVPSALAYALFLSGMRETSATAASLLTLLEPLTATVLAWALFGEQLGPRSLLGGICLLGALALLYRSERAAPSSSAV